MRGNDSLILVSPVNLRSTSGANNQRISRQSSRDAVIKMLNTRHKFAAFAATTTTTEEIITNEQLSPQSVFPRRADLPGDWPRHLTMPYGRGNFPTAEINFRARLVRLYARVREH